MLGWLLHYIFNYCQAAFGNAFTAPLTETLLRPGHRHAGMCIYSMRTVRTVT